MYAKYIKRLLDFLISLIAIVLLLPVIFLLIISGVVMMKGNPFFYQLRPGKNEKIFKLIKFRTMDNRRDKDGKLLPDDERLNSYGKFLRKTSLDELPELFNILIGDMSIVGPRPLLVKYLPYYSDLERCRHNVRPGLTGYAQANGRNTVNWEERFQMDEEYSKNTTFFNDLKIILKTVGVVLKREDVVLQGLEDFDVYRKQQLQSDSHIMDGELL